MRLLFPTVAPLLVIALSTCPFAGERAYANDAPSQANDEATNLQSKTSSLQKVGEAQLKVLFWTIYDVRLFTPDRSYREGLRPLRLEIQYRRDVSSEALVDGTRKEWEAMGRSHPSLDQWLDRLTILWPDIQKNDLLTLELNADSAATFVHNGEILGTIDDPEFAQQFLDIWMSTDTTRPEVRRGLIGQ